MKIRAGYEIAYECPQPTPMVLMLSVHPSRMADVAAPHRIVFDPPIAARDYRDDFDNICTRIIAPPGHLTVATDFIIGDPGTPDVVAPDAEQVPVQDLPDDVHFLYYYLFFYYFFFFFNYFFYFIILAPSTRINTRPRMIPLKISPQLLKKLHHTHKIKRLRLFFHDDSRIVHKCRVCRVCWKRVERPPGLCDKRFTFAYIFAAVEPGTDNAFALVLPYANTEAMQEFLDQFAATIGQDEHIVLILDQAGWHGAGALRVPASITLLPLPPYSPELNPVEWVWEYMKERFLSLRLHNDYDAIADAAARLKQLSAERSICCVNGYE